MQSSCVLRLQAEEDEELAAAGPRTVYRRYLRKFICVIPRVHGGYFKSSSCVIHRVHQERLQQFLWEDGFFKTSGSWQRLFIGEDRPRKPESGFVRREATLKTALARPEWPPEVVFCRNRDVMERGSSPSGDAAAGAGSARAEAARTGRVGVLGRGKGGRLLRRLHWLASEGLWVIIHIESETLMRDPYYHHPQQEF